MKLSADILVDLTDLSEANFRLRTNSRLTLLNEML